MLTYDCEFVNLREYVCKLIYQKNFNSEIKRDAVVAPCSAGDIEERDPRGKRLAGAVVCAVRTLDTDIVFDISLVLIGEVDVVEAFLAIAVASILKADAEAVVIHSAVALRSLFASLALEVVSLFMT